jgi:hypothetical protein
MGKIVSGIFGGGGGGGGGQAPTQQTVTQTNIPEYARPYVERMLGKSEALTDINANPYQAYGGQRLQGFTPMQEQAFQNYATQQIAPELGAGSNMAAMSGLGSMAAGGDYMRMATDPRSMQSFMSPYMQNVVDLQKQEATRDFQKGLTGINSRATAAGAFGGSRQAIERAEANRNLGTTLANIQATGTQNAFDKAQQAQQFGSTLGLQGLGQGLQGASILGQLGQNRFGQQMGISDAIARAGAVQQAQGQQGLDLAYQDFIQQKQYPYQQLAFQSDMLRGLPLSQAAQQQYTAPPSMMSQLGGLGTTALGIYGLSGGFSGKKDGGAIKGYKNGGSIGYLDGGQVEMMATEQLEKLLASPNLNPLEASMIQKELINRRRIEGNPETMAMMAGRSGIDAIGTGDMVPETMADGGIIAFSTGGSSKQKRDDYKQFLEDEIRASLLAQKENKAFEKTDAQIAEMTKGLQSRRDMAPWMAVTQAGLGMMSGTSPHALANIGVGGQRGLESYSKSLSDIEADRKGMLQQQVEAEKAKLARQTGLTGQMQTSLGQIYGREVSAEQAAASDRRTTSEKDQRLLLQMERTYLDKVQGEKAILAKTQKYNQLTDAQLEEMAKKNVNERLTPRQKEMLFGGKDTEIAPPPPAPAPAPAPGSKSFPKPSNAAISALKSRNDLDKAKEQFDAIFGPGAAAKALGK